MIGKKWIIKICCRMDALLPPSTPHLHFELALLLFG
jgi:hypothetical protein